MSQMQRIVKMIADEKDPIKKERMKLELDLLLVKHIRKV